MNGPMDRARRIETEWAEVQLHMQKFRESMLEVEGSAHIANVVARAIESITDAAWKRSQQLRDEHEQSLVVPTAREELLAALDKLRQTCEKTVAALEELEKGNDPVDPDWS